MSNVFFLPLEKSKPASILKVGFLIFFGCFLTLFLLQPFGEVIHGFQMMGIIRTLSYAGTAGGLYILMELYALPALIETRLGQTKYAFIFWYSTILFVITTGIFFCKNYWMDFSTFTLFDYGVVLYRVFSIAIIPSSIFMVYLYYSKSEKPENDDVVFSSNEKNPEYLRVPLIDVIALNSEQNYVSVQYLEHTQLKKKLLRNTLTNFEAELELPFIRIHRSCIVNLLNVKNVNGNSQGLNLTMSHLENPVKVSRSYITDFQLHWEKFTSDT
ncbi:MAG: LytTR family DNA-binding domain-containing protein [Balneola sp.]